MAPITIDVPSDIAEMYRSTPRAEQEKIHVLLRVWLRDISKPRRTLDEVMDEMSDYAESQGLTPEILEQLLRDDDES
jgi:pseudouridine-5'-phosphate glycosidase